MTTNCPEKLDEALLRAGRCDEKFKIDFATKVTAELTFKRIFGLDKQNIYSPEAIDRFASAFAAQFPARSKICTAELAKHCGQYRARPLAAIEQFTDWLKLGDDKFAYRREDLESVAGEGDFNVPRTFDPTLVQVRPEDIADTALPTVADLLPTIKVLPSKWNPICWLCAHKDDIKAIRHDLVASAETTPTSQSTLYNAFTIQVLVDAASCDRAGSPQAHATTYPTAHRGFTRVHSFAGFFATLGRIARRSGVHHVTDLDVDDDDDSESSDNGSLTIVSPRPYHDKIYMEDMSTLTSEDVAHISLTDNIANAMLSRSASGASTISVRTSQYTRSASSTVSMQFQSSRAHTASTSSAARTSSVSEMHFFSASSGSSAPRSNSDASSSESFVFVEDADDVFYDSEEH